ncbi:uncharacterized protein [Diabrotica undecimpunctata]|uniref:uncharacterized protein n=1 Tax=Diabrotica undecimpunctata TaxID=50387 RepID=UPI003B6389CA
MDLEKLILGVVERKSLTNDWYQTNKDYHNRDMARKMWISLAKEMGENIKDNMTQRNSTGNIPPLNNQENIYDENTTLDTITESDYDRNHNSELNSDPELNTEITFTTTPKAAKIAHTDKETGTKGKKAKSSVYEKMVAIEEEKLKAYNEKCKETPKEEDSDFHFFKSLMPCT